jgi:hypothetical protein
MKKYTPIFILSIFLAGVTWMIFGMKNAMDITDHRKVKKTQATTKAK